MEKSCLEWNWALSENIGMRQFNTQVHLMYPWYSQVDSRLLRENGHFSSPWFAVQHQVLRSDYGPTDCWKPTADWE
jgi:hypothetical protein